MLGITRLVSAQTPLESGLIARGHHSSSGLCPAKKRRKRDMRSPRNNPKNKTNEPSSNHVILTRPINTPIKSYSEVAKQSDNSHKFDDNGLFRLIENKINEAISLAIPKIVDRIIEAITRKLNVDITNLI